MPTTGTRGTASLSARHYDVADVISLLDVNNYPLLAILTNAGRDIVTGKGKAMKKKETTDPEFKKPFELWLNLAKCWKAIRASITSQVKIWKMYQLVTSR